MSKQEVIENETRKKETRPKAQTGKERKGQSREGSKMFHRNYHYYSSNYGILFLFFEALTGQNKIVVEE